MNGFNRFGQQRGDAIMQIAAQPSKWWTTSSAGVHDARTSISTVTGRFDSAPKLSETTRVTVPPAALLSLSSTARAYAPEFMGNVKVSFTARGSVAGGRAVYSTDAIRGRVANIGTLRRPLR